MAIIRHSFWEMLDFKLAVIGMQEMNNDQRFGSKTDVSDQRGRTA